MSLIDEMKESVSPEPNTKSLIRAIPTELFNRVMNDLEQADKMREALEGWEEFDINAPAETLRSQSGGYFWVRLDSDVHGKCTLPTSWSGSTFSSCNNSIITHFKKMKFPKPPQESDNE